MKSTVFKALTRTPLFLGVPLTVLVFSASIFLLLAIYFSNLLLFLSYIPVYLILFFLTKLDDKIFSILAVKFRNTQKRIIAFEVNRYFRSNYYTSGFSKTNEFGSEKANLNRKKEYLVFDINKAFSISDVIPYSSAVDDGIVLTNNGFLLATFELKGVHFFPEDENVLIGYRNNINMLLRSLAEEEISIYHHNIRDSVELHIDGDFSCNKFSKDINDLYFAKTKDNAMTNRLFITLCYKTGKNLLKGVKGKKLKEEEEKSLNDKILAFKEIIKSVESNLSDFKPIMLKEYGDDDSPFSRQLEFFNYLLTGNWQKVRILKYPIHQYISNADYHIGKKLLHVENDVGKSLYHQCIEIKDWVGETGVSILDVLLLAKCRYILTQSFSAIPSIEAKKQINMQIKKMRSAEDDSTSQMLELEESLDLITSGNMCFGIHHFTLFVFAEDSTVVKDQANNIMTSLGEMGFLCKLSNIALDEDFFAQLPGNQKFRTRKSLVSSLNFADMNALHNFAQGKNKNNCWGNAVTMFRGMGKQPYFFNFHTGNIYGDNFGEKLAGHTLILGSTGSGKTVLLSFLLTQMLKFVDEKSYPPEATKKFTAIFFDKDNGAGTNILALGGKYLTLKNGKDTGFNPFRYKFREEEKQFYSEFLVDFVGVLATAFSENKSISAKERDVLRKAVNSVLSLDYKDRTNGISRLLENIQDDNSDDSLVSRLSVWSKERGGRYAWCFDNEDDILDFESHNIYGFDGTEILDNKSVITPIAYYLIYRIKEVSKDSRRLVLFMDEFWKWLQGEQFADFIHDGLKTFRKNNAFIVGATQSPEDIIRSPIARAIIEQTTTLIALPNSKAMFDEYKNFRLTEEEFEAIKELKGRSFLVKKSNEDGEEAVIVDFDLSMLGKGNLAVLSSNEKSYKKMLEFKKESKNWLNEFKNYVEKQEKIA